MLLVRSQGTADVLALREHVNVWRDRVPQAMGFKDLPEHLKFHVHGSAPKPFQEPFSLISCDLLGVDVAEKPGAKNSV